MLSIAGMLVLFGLWDLSADHWLQPAIEILIGSMLVGKIVWELKPREA